MKNVLIISSTPRVGGNSEVLCKQFAKGAQEAGHNVEIVNLRDYKLNYCIGCYACHKLGKCFQNDGMNELSEKMLNANVIVLATPVYYYCMSGQLKVFIDRLTPIYEQVKAEIYLIATMWDPDEKMMEPTIEAMRGLTRDCFEDCREMGIICASDVGGLGEINDKPDYLHLAYTMGKNC